MSNKNWLSRLWKRKQEEEGSPADPAWARAPADSEAEYAARRDHGLQQLPAGPASHSKYQSILVSAAALEAEGDCIGALKEYERAIKVSRERPEAYLEAAAMLLRHSGVWKGNKQVMSADRALEYTEAALAYDESNLAALELLFHAELHTGQLHRAVQTASKLMELSPDRERWREEGRRTLATLRQMPQMKFLEWRVGPQGIDELHKKFGNPPD